MEQVFYGWYENEQDKEPAYSPPRDAPCPFCGTPVSKDDVRTHCFVFATPSYAQRSYFYRTHRTCAEKHDPSHTSMDGFIMDMITRNED